MNPQKQKTDTLLSADTGQALRELIGLSERILDISRKEAQALVKNDAANFAALQDEKAPLSKRFEKTGQEFRARLEDFKGADKALVNRLEALQKEIGEVNRNLRETIARMQAGTEESIQKTLIGVQEASQKVAVKTEDKPEDKDKGDTDET